MICLIVRRLYGIRGQEFFGMVKGTATQNSSIQGLRRGGRKILLAAFGMSMGIGAIQMKVLLQRLFPTSRHCSLPLTLAEFWKSQIQSPPK